MHTGEQWLISLIHLPRATMSLTSIAPANLNVRISQGHLQNSFVGRIRKAVYVGFALRGMLKWNPVMYQKHISCWTISQKSYVNVNICVNTNITDKSGEMKHIYKYFYWCSGHQNYWKICVLDQINHSWWTTRMFYNVKNCLESKECELVSAAIKPPPLSHSFITLVKSIMWIWTPHL